MASAPISSEPATTTATDGAYGASSEAERRAARLAELVAGLTGCASSGALHAVRENQNDGDALEVVARAMVDVDAPAPDGFRVAGFLRDDALVVHGSLRRWDRLHAEADRPEDQIVDARFSARRTIDLG
jgi:hypothetical protein